MNKMLCPKVSIPELCEKRGVIRIQKLVMLKGRCSNAVESLKEVINSTKWYHAWVKLGPREYGWFAIPGIFWRNTGNTLM